MKIEKLEDKENLSKIMDQIFEENDREHNAELGFRTFAYALKNDSDEIVGGVYGWKAFSEIYVDELCISKENRGSGYGKKGTSLYFLTFKLFTLNQSLVKNNYIKL